MGQSAAARESVVAARRSRPVCLHEDSDRSSPPAPDSPATRTAAGFGVVYWYSKACAAAGSSECAAVHQLASDDAGRLGIALYDYVNDPAIRADVLYAISATYHTQLDSEVIQAYLAGRIGLGVGMSYHTSPYGIRLTVMGLVGGALRMSQAYGSGVQLNHVIEGAIGGGGP